MKRENAEKIYLAIGDIDESLIEEATTPISQKSKTAQRIIAAAACATIVTAGILVSANYFNFGMKGESSPDFNFAPGISNGDNSDSNTSQNPMNPYPEHSDEEISNIMEIQGYHRESNIVSFILYIRHSTSSPINIHLYSENGTPIYSTDEDINPNLSKPVIIIDGEVSKELPTKQGSYSVSVIFGEESLEFENPDQDTSGPDTDNPIPPDVDPTDIFVIENMGDVLFSDAE